MLIYVHIAASHDQVHVHVHSYSVSNVLESAAADYAMPNTQWSLAIAPHFDDEIVTYEKNILMHHRSPDFVTRQRLECKVR